MKYICGNGFARKKALRNLKLDLLGKVRNEVGDKYYFVTFEYANTGALCHWFLLI